MIHSERLVYDKPQEKDFQRYFEIHSDPQTNLFNPAGPLTLENARPRFENFKNHWSDHDFGSWIISEKNTGRVAGFGGLSYRMYGDEMKVNLGYRFDKDFWAKGYATEMSRFAINFGFHILNFDQIYAIVRPMHAASIRILEKCNMKLSGTLDDVAGQEESLIYLIER